MSRRCRRRRLAHGTDTTSRAEVVVLRRTRHTAANFHYAIQVADMVCDPVAEL